LCTQSRPAGRTTLLKIIETIYQQGKSGIEGLKFMPWDKGPGQTAPQGSSQTQPDVRHATGQVVQPLQWAVVIKIKKTKGHWMELGFSLQINVRKLNVMMLESSWKYQYELMSNLTQTDNGSRQKYRYVCILGLAHILSVFIICKFYTC
jgi:hypothetical protein